MFVPHKKHLRASTTCNGDSFTFLHLSIVQQIEIFLCPDTETDQKLVRFNSIIVFSGLTPNSSEEVQIFVGVVSPFSGPKIR
jgi:hypothetical protein